MNKKTTVAHKYIVVVAEYDECGSDGMCIDNALPFDTPEEAAQFIVDDYNDTICEHDDEDGDDENDSGNELAYKDILKAVKRLKANETAEWDSPEEVPLWIKWKIFAR